MPICSGGVARVPQPDMSPHHACSVNSSAGAPASGPSTPKAEIVTTLVAARPLTTQDRGVEHVDVGADHDHVGRAQQFR